LVLNSAYRYPKPGNYRPHALALSSQPITRGYPKRKEFTFSRVLLPSAIFLGVLAFLYCIIGITSKEESRINFYEKFFFAHALFLFLALEFLYFHHHSGRPFVMLSLFIPVMDHMFSCAPTFCTFRMRSKSYQVAGQSGLHFRCWTNPTCLGK